MDVRLYLLTNILMLKIYITFYYGDCQDNTVGFVDQDFKSLFILILRKETIKNEKQ